MIQCHLRTRRWIYASRKTCRNDAVQDVGIYHDGPSTYLYFWFQTRALYEDSVSKLPSQPFSWFSQCTSNWTSHIISLPAGMIGQDLCFGLRLLLRLSDWQSSSESNLGCLRISRICARRTSLMGLLWVQFRYFKIWSPLKKTFLVPHNQCPGTQVFGTASIIWGVIGPARQFSKGQIY